MILKSSILVTLFTAVLPFSIQGQNHYCHRLLDRQSPSLEKYKEAIDCLYNDEEWGAMRAICGEAKAYTDQLLIEIGHPVDSVNDTNRHNYNLLRLERSDLDVQRAISYFMEGKNEEAIFYLTKTLNCDVNPVVYHDYESRNLLVDLMLRENLIESPTQMITDYGGKNGNQALFDMLTAKGYYTATLEQFNRTYPPHSIESLAGNMRRDATLTRIHRLLSLSFRNMDDAEMAFIHSRLAMKTCSKAERNDIVEKSIPVLWEMGLGCSVFWCKQIDGLDLPPPVEALRKVCCEE